MRSFILSLLMLVFYCANAQKYYLFVGTYTGSGSKGIYVYSFDLKSGKLQWLSNTTNIVNPSYLAIAPNHKCIYACTETRTANAGSVSAFTFDRSTGQLRFINKQPSGGDNPVYVSVHQSGKWVVVGNYTGGSLSAFPVSADGSLQPYRQSIQHHGKSINAERQEKAHVHSVVFSPNQQYLFAPDLGMDQITIYRFNSYAQQPLQAANPPYVATQPGTGPRHFTFHPNGRWAYLIEEMGGQVIAYDYNNGKLKWLQQIATHPDTAKGPFGSADIHISPDGNFLYTSNRANENTITIFSINKTSGKLKLIGYQSTMGKVPRNFVIDPTGNYLLVANQESGNIVVLKRNVHAGLLTYTGEQLQIPEPVCLQMMKQ